MSSTILAVFVNALISMASKLGGAAFLEKVLAHIVVYFGEKLAAATSNDLDDQLVAQVKDALQKGGDL